MAERTEGQGIRPAIWDDGWTPVPRSEAVLSGPDSEFNTQPDEVPIITPRRLGAATAKAVNWVD